MAKKKRTGWSNLWELRGGWGLESWGMHYVKMFHERSGLSKKVRLPRLMALLLDMQRSKSAQAALQKVRQSLGFGA